MRVLTDLHTHTNASTHAYSTLLENVTYAKKAGLEAIAMTNHGPDLYDGPANWHFDNMRVLPEFIEGIRVIKGIEASILNRKGELDTPRVAEDRGCIEICIASIHDPIYQPSNEKEFIETYENIAENSEVDIIGHIDRCSAFSNLDYLLPLFSKHKKFIEFNEFSFNYCNREKCMELIKKAKEHDSLVCVNTDSHFAADIGKCDSVLEYMKSIDFNFGNVINKDLVTLKKHLLFLK